jgi:chitodextrinase
MTAIVIPVSNAIPASATSSCLASAPAGASYIATVCIGLPAEGAKLTGDAQVTASISFSGTSPGVQRMIFSLDGQYLITDYAAPYQFTLSSAKYVDGAHVLTVQAMLRDTFVTQAAGVNLTFNNGITTPPVNTNTFTPATGTPAASGQPFVLAAAGDGAGGEPSEFSTTAEIASWNPNLFVYLGDVYEKGSPAEFQNWYGASAGYGQFRPITDPAIGNHEYTAGQAPGYFDYWDNAPHYYSVNTPNGWHIISLDSNGASDFGQTAVGSPQYNWLQADLKANAAKCTIAYWHHPLYNIGQEGPTTRMQDIWTLLQNNGVHLVLNGHDHTYQRWAPMDAFGNVTSSGITELVAGTGGHAIGNFVTSDPNVLASATVFGALRLELNTSGSQWQFITTDGTVLDSGASACSPTKVDTVNPSAPTNLVANPAQKNEIDLGWNESIDNVGVTQYEVWRDGATIATLGIQTTYQDTSVQPGTTHSYKVRARDGSGNYSAYSSTVNATTPTISTLFSDGFESADFSKWTSTAGGMTPEQQLLFSGAWAARATVTNQAATLTKNLASPLGEIYAETRFNAQSQSTNVNLMQLRNSVSPAFGAVLTASVSTTGKITLRDEVTGVSTTETTPNGSPSAPPGRWHTLQVHALVNGASSHADVWVDGSPVPGLSLTLDLGTNTVGRFVLGDAGITKSYDVAFDDVAYDGSFIADLTPPTPPSGLTAAGGFGPQVNLAWTPSTDDVAVTGYDVIRNGAFLITVPAASSYADTSVAPGSTYSYQLKARDAAGNLSAASNVASTTTPAVFADGFETGDLTNWTLNSGLTTQGANVYSGAWAAEASSNGTAGASAYRQLAAGQNDLYYRIRFNVQSQGANSVNLGRYRSPTGAAIVSLSLTSQDKLSYRNEVTGVTTTSTTAVSTGTWHEVQLRTFVNDTSSQVQIWLDGNLVVNNPESLGITPIGRVELGDSSAGRAFDFAYDDVLVETSFIEDTIPPTAPASLSAAAASSNEVDLNWSPGTDNFAVTGYEVFRNGASIATVGAVTTFQDTSVAPGSTYSYSVRSLDANGNESGPSPSASATPADIVVFGDDFESGTLAAWTQVGGLVTQQQDVHTGAWSALAQSSGTGTAFASETLAAPSNDLYLREWFDIQSQGANPVNLGSFRDSTGAAIASIFVSSTHRIGYRNDFAGPSTLSAAQVPQGEWHEAIFHLHVNGSASLAEIWLDGLRVLSQADTFGPAQIARVGVGESTTLRTYTVSLDDVQVVTTTSDVSPPAAPETLNATVPGTHEVDLAWTPASDDFGVIGYNVVRDGTLLATTTGGTTTYVDTSVQGSISYTYTVQAFDAAGNVSAPSPAAVATTPHQVLFNSSFESGDLSGWNSATGLAVQQHDVYSGAWAAESASAGGPGAATQATLAVPAAGAYYRLRFMIVSQGPSSVNLARFRTAAGGAVMTVFVSTTGKLGYRNDVAGVANMSTTSVIPGVWHLLQLHAATGPSGVAELWLDDVPVASAPESLGTSPLGRIELGETVIGRTFDVEFDDPLADTSFITDATPPTAPSALAPSASGASVGLSWTGSIDDIGVTGYQVVRNGVAIATVGSDATVYTDNSVAAATSYSYRVRGLDAEGNLSGDSNTVTLTTPDFAPPSAPTGLTATATATGTEIDLAWTASTDNVGVTAYQVMRDGSYLDSTAGTQYADTTVAPVTTHTYSVIALDAAGNLSAASSAASATTPDTIAPAAPTNLSGVPTSETSVKLTWFPATDNVAVTGYAVVRDGTVVATIGNVSTFTDSGLVAFGQYSYIVRASDAAGNISADSAAVVVQTLDLTAPSTPTNLVVTGTTAATASLSWTAAVDNVGVTNHRVFRNGILVATTGSATTFTDTGLLQLTAYSYSVAALDAAGNASGLSLAITATTKADTTPPSVPTGLVGNSPSSTEADLVWNPSTDDVGVTGYQVFRNGKRIATLGVTTSFADTTASSGTTYNYTVKAFDAAGNISAASAAVTVSTADLTPPTQPSRLGASAQGATKIALTWRASTDNVGVTGYQVFRNGAFLVNIGAVTSWTDTGLLPVTKYSYSLVAFDAVGNLSIASATVSATTTTDTTAPTAPTELAGVASSDTTVNLSWTAATDDVGVVGYRVLRNGTQIASIGAITTYTDSTGSVGTSYNYTLRALDAAGNISVASNTATVRTLDLAPPTAPSGLAATVVSPTKVNLTWTAATDNVGVTGYRVTRDGAVVATIGAVTSYSDTAAVPNAANSYIVNALDADGNVSASSNTASVTTPPLDVTPPSQPTSLAAVTVSASHINLTWSASTDNVGVASYQVIRNGAVIGTTSSTAYADLTTKSNTSYTYAVKAVDTSGNLSSPSNSATPATPLFYDGFETGNFSRWTTATGMTAQQQTVYAESWAARASNNHAATFADRDIAAQADLYARLHVFVSSQSTGADLLGFRLRTGSAILTLGTTTAGNLYYRNGINANVVTSSTSLGAGGWHEVKLHVKVSGTTSQVEVWLDGAQVTDLTRTDSLGATAIDRLELGDRSTTNSYTIAFDEVIADTKP